jgi:hypothetical protein
MALKQQAADIGTLSIASISLLADFENVTWTVDETQVDGSSMVSLGKSMNGTKLAGTLDVSVLSTLSTPDRVSHLNMTVLTVGGTNYLTDVQSFKLTGTPNQVKQPSAGSWWQTVQNTKMDFAVTLDIAIPVGSNYAHDLMTKMSSTTGIDRNVVLSVTINSVAQTIAMRMKSGSLKAERDGLQMFTLNLVGHAPLSGTYPTAPTGTTSLLEKAYNSWASELAFTFSSNATAARGAVFTGNCIIGTWSIDVADEGLVKTAYQFHTTGTVTEAASS